MYKFPTLKLGILQQNMKSVTHAICLMKKGQTNTSLVIQGIKQCVYCATKQ